MGKITRKLVEYNGIDNRFNKLKLFNQDNYDFLLYIDSDMPACEAVEKIWLSYLIVHTEKIETHKGVSLEGVKLTGNSLMILGDFIIKVQYIGSTSNKKIYTIEKKLPFSGLVTLPDIITGNEYFEATVVIEDINAIRLNKKCIYTNITASFSVSIY